MRALFDDHYSTNMPRCSVFEGHFAQNGVLGGLSLNPVVTFGVSDFCHCGTLIILRSLSQPLLVEISCRQFVQIALHRPYALQRDLALQLLHGTCQEDLAHDFSLQRELAESDLVSQSLFFMFLRTLCGASCWDAIIYLLFISQSGCTLVKE